MSNIFVVNYDETTLSEEAFVARAESELCNIWKQKCSVTETVSSMLGPQTSNAVSQIWTVCDTIS